FLVYRKIAGPLERLSAAVRAEADRSRPQPVDVAGPAEVASIAQNFNRLAAAIERQLDAGVQFTAIVNAAQDAIISESLDGTITSWNSGAEATYGYTAEEILGRNESVLVPSDRGAEQAHFLSRVAAGHLVDRVETKRRRKDGSLIDVAVTVAPVRDASGVITGAAVVSRDVTNALAAINDLRSSEARKSAILRSALDCVVTIDGIGRIVEFNPAAERTFGYRREDVLGRSLAELVIPPAMREAHNAGLARYLSSGEAPILGQRLELTAQRADGTEFPVEVAITQVELDGPPLFTGYLRDLTEQKKAEVAREALERRLDQSQRLEGLGQLAGGVAHDFNNLLAVIRNYADFIAEDTADNPAVHSDALEIRAAAERGARLTRQLLIFGRRETIQPQLLNLDTVIADLHNLLSRSIGEHVRLVVPPSNGLPLPPIMADHGQIEQVLVNLALNARDAMPTGGTLTIETDVVMLDQDHARIRPGVDPGWYVQLSVSDTGTGMSPEVVAKAFEPFFTTKPKGQGTGLGLATVYGIVSGAGGTISVYSEEGMGTTVRVYLPAAEGTPTDEVGPVAGDRLQGRGETILVVEDEAPMREVTTRILRRNGYRVLEASGGPEAVTMAASQPAQLLLTDVVMPVMSGRDVANAIARHNTQMPVIFMSGYSEGVLGPHHALDDGVTLVQKPFDERTLLEKVRTVLDAVPSEVGQAGGIS
ncbi:MAG: hypothetical protein QOJ19_3140, partial [Acidimicrobiia bacterium]|nr:hypothetical protein [Acidimicrobiia bacterium]